MYIAVSILIFIVCALLILIVLVQNSKGRMVLHFFLCFFKPNHGCKKDNRFLGKSDMDISWGDACFMYCIRDGTPQR